MRRKAHGIAIPRADPKCITDFTMKLISKNDELRKELVRLIGNYPKIELLRSCGSRAKVYVG